MAETAKQKFFKKYDSIEEAEKAWEEREALMARQAGEVGEARKALEAYQKQLQEYAAYHERVNPYVTWLAQNEDWVRQAAQARAQGQSVTPGQMQQAGQMVAQAQATGQIGILTPQEQQALTVQTAQYLAQNAFAPWAQNFTREVQKYADQKVTEVLQRAQQQNRSTVDVMWSLMERVLPQDKFQEGKAFVEESLKYTDPQNINPMELARTALAQRSEIGSLKSKLEELTKAQEAAQKAAIPGLGAGTTGIDLGPAERPKTREERFQRVLGAVRDQHGEAGVQELAGTGPIPSAGR